YDRLRPPASTVRLVRLRFYVPPLVFDDGHTCPLCVTGSPSAGDSRRAAYRCSTQDVATSAAPQQEDERRPSTVRSCRSLPPVRKLVVAANLLGLLALPVGALRRRMGRGVSVVLAGSATGPFRVLRQTGG